MQAKHPQLVIAGYHHGYFWDDEQAIVEKIRQSGAKLLFVAITSPKKENFINRWQEQLGVLFVMGLAGHLMLSLVMFLGLPYGCKKPDWNGYIVCYKNPEECGSVI